MSAHVPLSQSRVLNAPERAERDGQEVHLLSPLDPRTAGPPPTLSGVRAFAAGLWAWPRPVSEGGVHLGPPMLHTSSPLLHTGPPTPVPWGAPGPQEAQRHSHARGLISLGEW